MLLKLYFLNILICQILFHVKWNEEPICCEGIETIPSIGPPILIQLQSNLEQPIAKESVRHVSGVDFKTLGYFASD